MAQTEYEVVMGRLLRQRTAARVEEVIRWALDKAGIDLTERGWWRMIELELAR